MLYLYSARGEGQINMFRNVSNDFKYPQSFCVNFYRHIGID